MKQIFQFTITLLLLNGIAQAQPDTLWTKTYGDSTYNRGRYVQQTNDGGFIVLGSTGSLGIFYSDIYLIKTDAWGGEQWNRTFGGDDSDEAGCVIQTNDNGYIIAGYTESFGAGTEDVYLIKTDSLGIEQWSYTYGDSIHEFGLSIDLTDDGGYIVTGYKSPDGLEADLLLMKVDSLGAECWSQTYNYSDITFGNYVLQTDDGGYVVAGSCIPGSSSPAWDILLLKTDSLGFEQWHRTYAENEHQIGQYIDKTDDGGYILVGCTGTQFNSSTILVKTDSIGNEQWSQVFDYEEYIAGSCVQQTFNGDYIVSGTISNPSFDSLDVYLLKTDSNGNEIWNQTYGGLQGDYGANVQQTEDGGYIIAGSSFSYGAGSMDIYLIRLDTEGTLVEDFGRNSLVNFVLYPPFPNPFNDIAVIRFENRLSMQMDLEVFDITGKRVATLLEGQMSTGISEIYWEVENMASGLYFIRLNAGRDSKIQKVIYLK